MTPAGIEPVTFQFVAQHLNHCATTVPNDIKYKILYIYACYGHLQLQFHYYNIQYLEKFKYFLIWSMHKIKVNVYKISSSSSNQVHT
jgi:hypothetical protein